MQVDIRKPAIRLQWLSSLKPVNGTDKSSRKADAVNARLNVRSGIPCSTMIHWAKYRKKTMETIELAKSYSSHRNTFCRVFMP